jgi:hypothetical protein
MKTRINLSSTTLEALVAMSDGNPGAAVALSELIKNDESKGLLQVLMLDEWGIYGSDIWVLYSDICQKDVLKMSAVITATQRGKFNSATLKNACGRQDYSGRSMVPVEDLISLLKTDEL